MVFCAAGRAVWPRGVLGSLLFLWLAACGSDQPPTPPASGSPSGATPVYGTERLAWDQEGEVSELRFQAYVDGLAVKLDAAKCSATTPGSQSSPCESPLPPLTDGLHKIALTAVSLVTGLESAQSASIMVQKLSVGGASSISAAQSEGPAQQAVRAVDESLVSSNGLTFGVRVVATGLDAPSDLAAAPDGRLFAVEASGRVLVIRLTGDGPAATSAIVDAGVTLEVAPGTTPSLAIHPAFPSNHFVYLGYLSLDPDGQTRLRVVRMREVGDSLHERTVVYEQFVVAAPRTGVRIRFGPDGQLYVVSPQRVEPAPGSRRGDAAGVIVRLGGDGRAQGSVDVFASGTDRPLALAWLPGRGTPWAVLADSDGRAVLSGIGAGSDFGTARVPSTQPLIDAGLSTTPGAIVVLRSTAGQPPTLLVALPDNESILLVGLGETTWTETLFSEVLGRVGSIAQDARGSVYVATRNRDGYGAVAAGDDLIVCLSPRGRAR